MSVYFYHECWKTRCVELHKEENQKEILKKQVKEIKESDVTEKIEGMHEYLSKYEINEEEAKCDEMRNWIKGWRMFMRNAPRRNVNTLNDWLEE